MVTRRLFMQVLGAGTAAAAAPVVGELPAAEGFEAGKDAPAPIAVDLGPDDVLVLHVPAKISPETSARLQQAADRFLKSESRCMVLSEGITYSVIHRGKHLP